MKSTLFFMLMLMISGSLCASNKGKLSELRNRTNAGTAQTDQNGAQNKGKVYAGLTPHQKVKQLQKDSEEADKAATCCGVAFIGCMTVTACCVWKLLKS